MSNVSKCGKCGSKKHSTTECTVDLSKLKCFKCSQFGHISANCPQARNKENQAQGKGVKGGPGKGKGHDKGKGKGNSKGKGYGKKGKLNELEQTNEDWWYQDDSWWWYEQGSSPSWDTNTEWQTSQVWWDNSWQAEPEAEQQAEGSGQVEGENKPTIGSLILSPLLMDLDLEEAGCGLWLEESQEGDTEVASNDLAHTLHPQPFGVSVPQPFDVVPHTFSFGLIGDERFCKEETSGYDLCAPVSARVQVFSTKVSTFLDEPEQTCSKDAQ